jgi:hypothetical protein
MFETNTPQTQQVVVVQKLEEPGCSCCNAGVTGLSFLTSVVFLSGCFLYFWGESWTTGASIVFALFACFYLYVAFFYSALACRIASVSNKFFSGLAAILTVVSIIMVIENKERYTYLACGVGTSILCYMFYWLGYKYEEFFWFYQQEEGLNLRTIYV